MKSKNARWNYGEPAGVGRCVRSMVLCGNGNCCLSSIIFSSSARAHWNLGTGRQTTGATSVVRALVKPVVARAAFGWWNDFFDGRSGRLGCGGDCFGCAENYPANGVLRMEAIWKWLKRWFFIGEGLEEGDQCQLYVVHDEMIKDFRVDLP